MWKCDVICKTGSKHCPQRKNGHRKHAQKTSWSLDCGFWDMRADRQTDRQTNTLFAILGTPPREEVIHCVSKKDTTQPPTIILTIVVRFQWFLVQILLSKYAIERWFDIPPRLLIVRTLPWETLRPENNKFSSKGASFWVTCILFVHYFC